MAFVRPYKLVVILVTPVGIEFFVLDKGELYTWGLSHRGRLGNGEPTDFDNDIAFSPSLPNKVEIVSRQFVLDMACGGAHTLAIVIELDDSVKTTVANSNEPAKTSTTELEQ